MTSSSLIAIEQQYNKQKLLDQELRAAGFTGKRSLLKNFVLRNSLVSDEQLGLRKTIDSSNFDVASRDEGDICFEESPFQVMHPD